MSFLETHETLVVFAIEAEAQGRFDDLAPLYCGVGKINAAYRLTHRLANWRQLHGHYPSRVLNLGSAGSATFNAGDIVNCTRFVQRDFDATALGHELYVTPLDDVPWFIDGGLRFEAFPEGVCGTGDSFMTCGTMTRWNVVDMEAYALAKVCHIENIPFGCLKYITDGADGSAAETWENGLPAVAKSLREAVERL